MARHRRAPLLAALLALCLLCACSPAESADVERQIELSKLSGQTDAAFCPGPSASAAPARYAPVELIYQGPELPNGCEVTSLAMLLRAAGYQADALLLYQDYLPVQGFTYQGGQRFAPSPEDYYIGDATSQSDGWYCLEGPILQAGNGYLGDVGGADRVIALPDLTLEELAAYAQAGVPLALWVTLGYAQPAYAGSSSWILPSGEVYLPYSNLHCVVLSGMEDGQFLVADPIYGSYAIAPETLWDSFSAMGCRAVMVDLAQG